MFLDGIKISIGGNMRDFLYLLYGFIFAGVIGMIVILLGLLLFKFGFFISALIGL